MDADGYVLPRVQPEAAWDAASGLASVAAAAQAAADALSAAPATAVCWSGEAADAYRVVRERMARRTVQLAEVASAGAGVVLDWLRAAAPALAEMRATAERLEAVQRHVVAAAALAYDPALDASLQAEIDAGLRRWHAAREAYWVAVDVAARRLVALRDGITDRPLDVQDQVESAARTVWAGYVADPARQAWGLTGLALVDRNRWWDNVSGLPGKTLRGLAGAASDPRGTAAALIDVDAWRSGHYGEAAASLAVLFLPGPKWLGTSRDLGAVRFAKNIADRTAPKPVLQTVDEMLEGVDLERHEHAELGHALRRHVDVDDEYLMDRLTYGTLVDESTRGAIPPQASRFTDRAAAEGAITEALRAHEAELKALANAPVGKKLLIKYRSLDPLGQVMTPAPGGFRLDEGNVLVLRLTHGPDGPYIYTAYVESS